ncbi:hypothetical protein EFA46_003665 [Halarchaeum sp. CBA1220]|uniref:DUF7561 family protein n=1 Tax=Halarchaeum sp. CBA1220 TaxID=1853682 RepID=UPI000F3A8BF6|nr:hypothetical protein [Halarchaeum sp. CBA1220]QLC33341.1 hypothetical protein EFA46_003665 [Halarchaeum sp. CBA1220]
MSTRRCDACGERVEVPGGVGDFWDFGDLEKAGPGGLTLELEDDSEFFLCFDCIERLPENPSRADVAAISGE